MENLRFNQAHSRQAIANQANSSATAAGKRLVVEASSSFGWHKDTGFDGDAVSVDRFGASTP
jgi:transketolase